MNTSWQMITVGVALFATMAAYALFAGADLGAGIWDALSGGEQRGAAPRAAIRHSITPVWEANNVWIIFGLVIVWTAFPTAFAAITTTLFVPLALSLLGIVLRGTGFAFRHEADRLPAKALTTAVFAGSSVIAPFFLGTAVGAVTTGRVHAVGTDASTGGATLAAWTSPVAIVTGVLFVTTCAFVGGVYLVADCRRRGHEPLARYFGRRAAVAGILSGALAGVNLVLLRREATYVSHRLLHTAGPLVAVSVLAGAAALAMITSGRTRGVRPVVAVAVCAVVAAWGWAQYPYLLPRTLVLADGSATSTTLDTQLVIIAVAAVIVGPSFVFLYWLQQHGDLRAESASPSQLRVAVAAENQPSHTAAEAARGHHLLTGLAIAAATAQLVRSAVSGARSRRTDTRR